MTGEYNIDLQVIAMSACPTIDMCADVHSPMLCTLAEAFPTVVTDKGERVESTAITWMQAHLIAVSKYVNVKMKMSDWQMNALCQQIIADYPYVTMMEFILFCARLRSGQYGSFYGSIDPLIITKAFSSFMDDRNQDYGKRYEREKIERAERDAEESKRKSIGWEEYCRLEGIEGRESILDGREHFVPKKKVEKESPEYIMGVAQWLEREQDREIRENYSNVFISKYGCSPKEYITKNQEL